MTQIAGCRSPQHRHSYREWKGVSLRDSGCRWSLTAWRTELRHLPLGTGQAGAPPHAGPPVTPSPATYVFATCVPECNLPSRSCTLFQLPTSDLLLLLFASFRFASLRFLRISKTPTRSLPFAVVLHSFFPWRLRMADPAKHGICREAASTGCLRPPLASRSL